MSNKNIEMIQVVSTALNNLDVPVIFIGGATVSLYLNLDTAEEVRPTEDVDVIIEILSSLEYSKLSEKLLKLRFMPDTTKGAPLCRWKYLGVSVDIMPMDEKVLGFSNTYYKEAFKIQNKVLLPNGEEIRILPIEHFLLIKIEAFKNRGLEDPRLSKDLEDIVAILKDGKEIDDLETMVSLKSKLNQLFEDKSTVEAIRAFTSSAEEFNLIGERLNGK
jgi:predicted nucleotidyltransferase